MLNDLLVQFGTLGIKYILDLCSNVNHHPMAFYCTAREDYTGMIATIIIMLLGADNDIIKNYSLSTPRWPITRRWWVR